MEKNNGEKKGRYYSDDQVKMVMCPLQCGRRMRAVAVPNHTKFMCRVGYICRSMRRLDEAARMQIENEMAAERRKLMESWFLFVDFLFQVFMARESTIHDEYLERKSYFPPKRKFRILK